MDQQIAFGFLTGMSISLLVMGLIFMLVNKGIYRSNGILLVMIGLLVLGIKLVIWGF